MQAYLQGQDSQAVQDVLEVQDLRDDQAHQHQDEEDTEGDQHQDEEDKDDWDPVDHLVFDWEVCLLVVGLVSGQVPERNHELPNSSLPANLLQVLQMNFRFPGGGHFLPVRARQEDREAQVFQVLREDQEVQAYLQGQDSQAVQDVLGVQGLRDDQVRQGDHHQDEEDMEVFDWDHQDEEDMEVFDWDPVDHLVFDWEVCLLVVGLVSGQVPERNHELPNSSLPANLLQCLPTIVGVDLPSELSLEWEGHEILQGTLKLNLSR